MSAHECHHNVVISSGETLGYLSEPEAYPS